MDGDQRSQTDQEDRCSITLSDLRNVLTVIDLAARRGTFHGEELSDVGRLYDRLRRFILYSEANPSTPA
jgi:hypothetical protein